MNFYIKYLGVGRGGSRISIEIQNLLTKIDYVDEDCLSSLFENHPTAAAVHPRIRECLRVKQTVLENNKVKDLRALIEQSGFMKLNDIYGESQGGRAYNYVIEAKLEDIEKTVTYLSSPAASPAPKAFAEVQARILEIFNQIVQEPVSVPVSPQQTVTDITLFEHPSDPTTKFYLPRYAIAEQNVSGKQQFQISLQQSGLGGTLTVHLKQYPASEIEISSRDANIINHRVSVLLSHRSTVDGSSSERRQLTFQEVTTEPGGVRAVLKLSSLNEYNRLFQVMTNSQFDSILVVNRDLTVAVPPLYEEISYILDDRSDRLNPFVFPQALHPYIYEDVNLLDGLIQRTVTWSSSSWSYYQDAAQRHVFKYLPHVFKLARSTEPPYYPDLSVQFVWNGTSSIPDQVKITYRAAPFTEPNRRVAEAQQLQQLIDRVPVFEPLVAKSRLQIILSNTWTSSGQPHIKDPIDLRRDFKDTLTLTLEGFRELFNSLFTQTSALKGEVVVDVNENQQEIIPLIGRVNDLAPLDDGNVAPPAVPDRETLLKFLLAAQVPPKIEQKITVATFAPLFEPSNDHPGNPIIAIMVDFFGQGNTVSLTPDKLTDTVTLYLPLVDYVLNESIQGTYRYQVTIIYKNGESIKRSEQQSDDTKLYILKSEGV